MISQEDSNGPDEDLMSGKLTECIPCASLYCSMQFS